jgi:hypothetical protein
MRMLCLARPLDSRKWRWRLFFAVLHNRVWLNLRLMRKPKLIELEFMMLMFLVGGALVHGLLKGLFAIGHNQ